eukprot:scaffold1449_cov69-Phaeocystis_antarctica.AAC.1
MHWHLDGFVSVMIGVCSSHSAWPLSAPRMRCMFCGRGAVMGAFCDMVHRQERRDQTAALEDKV